ncbi:MAG: FAD synthetase family protein, partial [Chloroflexi bacterium]|nr:FAD synthetase family protein [Chloroflexota bacterium]
MQPNFEQPGARLAVEELRQATASRPTVVTIGVFDGVHLGHQHLIARIKELAAARGLLSAVVTFRQHPQTVLRPGSQVLYLTGLEERIGLLRQAGADVVAVLTFTRELSQLTARQFVGLLQDTLQMQSLVVGPDFALGRGREGNPRVLAELGMALGFAVEVAQPLVRHGVVVSSTSIRQAVGQGDVAQARSLLGRPFALTGTVVE